MDYPGRLIAGFIAIMLIIIFPLQYIAQSQNENMDTMIDDYTKSLTESIREKGYLDKTMYEKFINGLDSTGELYDIDMEDIHPITGDDISEQASIEEESALSERSLVKVNSVKSVKSVKSSAFLYNTASEMLFSLAAHIHTDACYAGHRHQESGCVPVGDLSQQIHLTSTNNSISPGGGVTINIHEYEIKCMKCDNVLFHLHEQINTYSTSSSTTGTISYIRYNSTGSPVMDGTTVPTHSDGSAVAIELQKFQEQIINAMTTADSTGPIGYFPLKKIPTYKSTDTYNSSPTYVDWIGCPYCGKYGDHWSCGKQQDETPICDKVVTGITATNAIQTVNKGENIISTATATYLDGHTGTVNCTVSGYDSNKLGIQTATLTYSGLVNNAKTTWIKTCTVEVTVKSAKTLVSLGVNPSSQTIMRYGTPSFAVTAYYSDGTSKTLTKTEYSMTTLDNSLPGSQSIKFSYTEASITKTATATVNIDALSSITVTPKALTVERYTSDSNLPITITAAYLYSGNKTVKSGFKVSGYDPSKLGSQNITISYTDNGITKSYPITVTVTVLHRVCPRCGNTYDFNEDDSDPGCPYCKKTITNISVTPDYMEVTQGNSLPITVNATYADGSEGTVTGWTSNYNNSKTGLQIVTVEYGGFAADITVWVKEAMIKCPVCGNEYTVSAGKCPVCAEKVISISANPTYVTVNQYDDINLTVTATYTDGHSNQVTDWSIDRTTDEPGTFKATISYQNVSTKVTINVISATAVICPICGLAYEPEKNPKGCPVCSNTVTGIEAYLTSGSNLVQYGSTPGITVVLIFRDTHRELQTSGYTIVNYNAYRLGEQTVAIKYDIFQADLVIQVVNTLQSVTCPNGHVYYLNEDGTDPGCPYCRITDKLNTVYYFDISYFNEIINKVYKDGIYYFDQGNYLSLIVKKKDLSLLTRMQNMFLGTAMLGRKNRYIYGGEVMY